MVHCECIQCGYDLTTLATSHACEVTCPECGVQGPPMVFQPYKERAREFRSVVCGSTLLLAAISLGLVILGIGVNALDSLRAANGFFFGLAMLIGGLTVATGLVLPFGQAAASRADAQWRHDRGRIWGNLLLTLAINVILITVAMVAGVLLATLATGASAFS